jgi:hypothetical protein
MFNQCHPAGREWLQDRSGTIHEELDRIEWQGEQVYRTSAHNALASRAIIDKLTPLLPKDSEEVNLQVKQLHAMLDATMMTDPTQNLGAEKRDQDHDHRQSLRGDSVNNVLTSRMEPDQGRGEENLWDLIRSKDA